jgi:hypothetical protein
VSEEGNFLPHSVLEHFDVIFGQIIDEDTLRIAGGERDVYQPDVYPEGFLT